MNKKNMFFFCAVIHKTNTQGDISLQYLQKIQEIFR